jgi:hypothetical protein
MRTIACANGTSRRAARLRPPAAAAHHGTQISETGARAARRDVAANLVEAYNLALVEAPSAERA